MKEILSKEGLDYYKAKWGEYPDDILFNLEDYSIKVSNITSEIFEKHFTLCDKKLNNKSDIFCGSCGEKMRKGKWGLYCIYCKG